MIVSINGESMSERDPIKVYDARWEEGEFDDAAVRRLFESALIYGRSLGVENVTITRDARLAGPRVMELAMEVALGGGFRTFACIGPLSTPQSYYLAHRTTVLHGPTMGLAITASHNPGRYIGAKFTVPPVRAVGLDCGPEGGLTRVREIFHGGERLPARGHGRLHIVDVSGEYVDYSLRAAPVADGELDGISVVLEALNGAAGDEIYRALDRAGVDVTPLDLIPDGRFPLGAPNPTSHGKMDAAVAVAAAQEEGAVGPLVIGVDGDGDRLVFGDGSGMLSAGFASIAVLRSERFGGPDTGPAPVLYDPKVNPVALELWGRYPVAPLLFRNGHSQIKDYMEATGARFAAEESGHYYHHLGLEGIEINAENSVVTSLRFLKGVHERPELLSEMRAAESRVFSTGELNFRLSSGEAVTRALGEIVDAFRTEGASIVTATPDGIDLGGTQISRGVNLTPGKIRLADGWYTGYLRESTNEKAVIRAFFTAGDRASGEEAASRAIALLRSRFDAQQIE